MLYTSNRHLLQWRCLLHWSNKLPGAYYHQRRNQRHGDGDELLSSDGCGSTAVFHQRTVDLVAPKEQALVGQRIFQLGPVNGVFSDDFELGTTASWH
jgi:hypothetical protein